MLSAKTVHSEQAHDGHRGKHRPQQDSKPLSRHGVAVRFVYLPGSALNDAAQPWLQK